MCDDRPAHPSRGTHANGGKRQGEQHQAPKSFHDHGNINLGQAIVLV
jgi:hypothetical protein